MQATGVPACSSCSRSFTSLLIFTVLVGLCLPAWSQESAQVVSMQHPLITAPIDETQLTTLRGNIHPLAKPVYDVGSAPATLPMQRMLLVLKRSSEQEAALRKLLDDQQDKGSPNYHKWLTPEQFGKQFGPSDDDMAKITAWLQSHGFAVGTTKGRTVLEFSGTAGQVREAFHTSIHKYVVNGQQHWANANDPQIPAALTTAVAGVFTLHNFVKKPMYRVAKERIRAQLRPGKSPLFTAGNGLHALAPADFATIYDINPLYTAATPINGSNIVIGVVGRSDISAQDVSQFRSAFAITGPVPQVIVNGPDPGDVSGDDLEGTLDVSWSNAIAPGAQVYFVNSAVTNTTDGVTLSEIYIIENDLSNIMTYSFGGCEAQSGGSASLELALAEQASAQGISFMASTGDAGAEGCDDPNTETIATGPISVNLPASTPFTTAVGGTIFNELANGGSESTYWNSANDATLGSAISYIPEDAWNESCSTSCPSGVPANILAGGGGVSSIFTSKPSWQAGVTGIPADNARDLPDVSLSAAVFNDPYLLCFQGSCTPTGNPPSIQFIALGGTSASSPSFAAIMALVDQKMSLLPARDNSPRQGLANYVLYPLAAAQQSAGTPCKASTTPLPNSACVFNDVTIGNNAVPGEAGSLYQAGTGYDQATGLGSINVTNLVDAWANATFRPTTTTLTLKGNTTPISVNHGTPVSVTITVAATSGTGIPAGDVALIAGVGPVGTVSNTTSVDGFTLTGGTFSGTTSNLPGGGPYLVTAHYAGNSTPTSTGPFAPSDSSPGIQVTVAPEASTTTASVQAFDFNGNQLSSPFPFGSLVFARADVAGASGQGTPTGMVKFRDSGTLPTAISGLTPPIVNPVSLNSQGNAVLGSQIINFDAGNHNISAQYLGDASFNQSPVSGSVAFVVSPGFAGVSGLGPVTISAPGGTGKTTIGIITSSNFSTAITFTCPSGLPTGAACSSASANGKGPTTVVNTTITITTTAPTAMLQWKERRYYYAVLLGGGLPLAGIFLIGPPRRRWSTLLGLMLLAAFLVVVPGCGGGGGGGHQQQQNPGTPTGSYNVTLTATAGSLSESGTFVLTVQ